MINMVICVCVCVYVCMHLHVHLCVLVCSVYACMPKNKMQEEEKTCLERGIAGD